MANTIRPRSRVVFVLAFILVLGLPTTWFLSGCRQQAATSNSVQIREDKGPDSNPRLFEIGMAHEEMIRRFGPPFAYYAVDLRRDVSPDEYPIACNVSLCRPIYHRRTALNEYRIVVFETADDSESRLHPTVRIETVQFLLDQDMPPEIAIKDIAEAHALCPGGCRFPLRRSDMFIATGNRKTSLWFRAHNRLKAVDKNTPISEVSIFISK